MKYHSHYPIALVTAICFLGIACAEAPTGQAPDELAPAFAKPPGKGKPEPDPPTIVTINDYDELGVEYNIGSDRREEGMYVGGPGGYWGDCKIDARINGQDAILRLGIIKTRKEKEACPEGRRSMHVRFPDQAVPGSPNTKAGWFREMHFMNVDHVEFIPVGATEPRTAWFCCMGCAQGLAFNYAQSTADFPVNDVLVTRVDAETWEVTTQPWPNNVAVCIPDAANEGVEREYYNMDFELTVKLK